MLCVSNNLESRVSFCRCYLPDFKLKFSFLFLLLREMNSRLKLAAGNLLIPGLQQFFAQFDFIFDLMIFFNKTSTSITSVVKFRD